MSLAVRTARNTLMVVAARMASKVLVLVVVVLMVRTMGAENYGRYTALVVYAALVSILADLGLRPLFTREVAKDRARLTPYLNSILSLRLVLALPVLVVLYVAVRVGLPSLTDFVIPTFLLLISQSLANQLRATFYALGRLRYEAYAIIGETVVLFVAALLVVLLRLDWWYFMYAYVASYLFTCVYAVGVTRLVMGHHFRFDLDRVRLWMLARESLPFALSLIITTLYFKVDVPILKLFTTFVAVGIYSAAYKMLEAVIFVPQTLMDPIYPSLAMLAQDNLERLTSASIKAYKLLAVVGVPVALGMIIFAQPIAHYAIQIDDAIPVLQVLSLGVLFIFLNNVFIYTLNAMGRQSDSTRLAVISLVVNVALNLVLIPLPNAYLGGYMGAAWATGLTEVALFVGGWYLLRKHLFALPIVSSLRGVLPAGVVCGLAMGAVVIGLGAHIPVYILALALGAVLYPGVLVVTRAFTADEIAIAKEAARSLTRR
jgi:O-antigen/teichoic acid export membrane protein